MSLSRKDYLKFQKENANFWKEKMGLSPHKDANSNRLKWGHTFETRLTESLLTDAGNKIHKKIQRNKRTLESGEKNASVTFPVPSTGVGVSKKIVKENKLHLKKRFSKT
jgi:hypothetical protein